MYLTDEFGQRYDTLWVSEAAGYIRMLAHDVYYGSYAFPLPTNGARTFIFCDDDRNPPVFVMAVLP